jgi:hypothetical protein
LCRKAADQILANVDCGSKHGVREAVAVHEDTNACCSTTFLHDLPVARCDGDIIGINRLAVATLVVADEEGDVFL